MINPWVFLHVLVMSQTFTEAALLLLAHMSQVSRWESLALNIIQRFIQFTYDVQVVCENACSTDEFLQSLSVPVQLNQPRLHDNSMIFIMTQSNSFLMSVLASTANWTKSKYVIFLDCDSVTVEWVLKQCWLHKLLSVLVIPIEKVSLPIYTYFPFAANTCFNLAPKLLGNFTNSLTQNIDLFPKRKVWDLQNCTLNVSALKNVEIYLQNGNLRGRYSPIFKAVADAMNFRAIFIHPGRGLGAEVPSGLKITGIRGDAYTGRAQLGFAPLFLPVHFEYLDYDSLALTACVTWCVPPILKQKSVWWLIFGELDPPVWYLLLLAAICTVVADVIILSLRLEPLSRSRSSFLRRFLDIWAALLQLPADSLRFSLLSSRILWISWFLLSLIISTGYLSTLKSFRTAPTFENALNSLDDLAEAGLEAWYPDAFSKMLDDIIKTNPAVHKLTSKSVPYTGNMRVTLVSLLPSKRVALMATERECRSWAEETGAELYPLPHACMQKTSVHFFIMAKKSVFTDAISTLMSRLAQAGIIQMCVGDNVKSSKTKDTRPRPLTSKDIMPLLLVVAFGLSVSVGVILFEFVCIRITGSA